jgi:hypothetical protein
MQDLHICSNFGKRETETKRFLTEVEPARAAERRGPVVSVDLIKKCGHSGLGRFELGPAGIIIQQRNQTTGLPVQF